MGWNRSQYDDKKLLRLYYVTKNKYGKGVYFSKTKNLYIKIQPSHKSKMVKYYKRQGARRVRHNPLENDGRCYKKYYDIWWRIF